MLVFANLSLAAAQFAEPVLFGRIVDRLAGAQQSGAAPRWIEVLPLLSAWVAFALFMSSSRYTPIASPIASDCRRWPPISTMSSICRRDFTRASIRGAC
jgi:hypothetical protein